MVFNAGPGVATITNKVIVQSEGIAVDLSDDTCGPTLAARRACIIAAAPIEQVAYSCRFVTSGGRLRGTIAVYGDTDNMLHSSDLR